MKTFVKTIKTALSDSAKVSGYVLDNSTEMAPNRQRKTIVLCPGGGYVMTSDREAEPVAMQFLALDCNVFILRYSVAPARYPVALLELAETMRLVRANAADWHVDPDRIVVAGFSAGGHLAADLAVQWDRDLATEYGFDPAAIKPNGLFLGYSVISSGPFAHQGSFEALLGDKYGDEALMTKVSLEKQVTASAPASFIWCTATDDTVPMENSLLFTSALHQAGVSVELHLFPQGGHGLSLGTAVTAIADNGYGIQPQVDQWPALFASWLANNI
ncbi:alpha/beta hydrolase [Lacticaseibacillus mingshuiensis]|uniref:Alpha/beta hydrolase n=1 Tax=Lacticaseibacillus mingshuiensis TaxID=2799574 RepID=A0ABW4CJL4_9LACO|nr:alpha/beta hydrolase [Lacticaseibacillus mingshuiensis]